MCRSWHRQQSTHQRLIGVEHRHHIAKADILGRLECAPGAGQMGGYVIDRARAFRGKKPMPRRHRSHSTEFKRQVAAEYHAGETLHALARRHDLSRNLIRIWVEKAEAGGLDADESAAELLTAYEARIAALEQLVGRQALELEFRKGGAASRLSLRSAPTSMTSGPAASRSSEDAN